MKEYETKICKYCKHSKEEHGKGGHRCAGFSCLHGNSLDNCDYFNYRYDIDGRNEVLLEFLELSKTIRDRLHLDNLDDMLKLYHRNNRFKQIIEAIPK